MTNSSMTTTDSLAKVVSAQDMSEITIERLSERLSAQIDENRRLIVENRILWDLLLFDGPGAKMDLFDDCVNWLVWRCGDKFIHSGAKQMLRKMGPQVTLTTNGLEALEQWRQDDFDLILMDVQIPEMNGRQAVTQIRRGVAIGAHVPIVVMTASAMSEERDRSPLRSLIYQSSASRILSVAMNRISQRLVEC
jgi:CheY-like chemotaxis protein